MLILSLIVITGAAIAIPTHRQLFPHSPEYHEALGTRATDWDGVLPQELGEESQRGNHLRFVKRANALIDLMMESRSAEHSANGPSSQDPYGTGKRFDKDSALTLREAKPPARIQVHGSPVHGGSAVSIRSADADGGNIWIPDSKTPARIESYSLPPHDSRNLVEEGDQPPGHIGVRGWGQDFHSTRQEIRLKPSL